MPSNPVNLLSFKNRLWATTDAGGGGFNVTSKVSALWKFNEGSGTTADNAQGNAVRDLTGVNTPGWDSVGQKLGASCTELNGTDEYWYVADTAAFEPGTGDFAFCDWIYPTATAGGIVGKGLYGSSSAATDQWAYIFTSGMLLSFMTEVGDDITYHTATSGALTLDAWNFVWIRRRNGILEMGSTLASVGAFNSTPAYTGDCTADLTNNTNVFTIGAGRLGATAGYYMKGKIDQAMWCKGSYLTDEDLTALYNLGTGTENTSLTITGGVPNRLYFSDSADYDSWTATSYLDIPSDYKNNKITCIAPYYDTLIIGLSDCIWMLYGSAGNPESDWALKKSNSPIGMKAGTQTAVVNGVLFFIGYDDQLWGFDGNTAVPIGEKMDVSETTGQQTMLAFNGDLWGIRGGGMYTFDSTRQVFAKSDFGFQCLFTDGQYLYGGYPSDGRIFRLNEGNVWSGPGTSGGINGYFETKWFDFNSPHNKKSMFDMWVYAADQSHSGPINIYLYRDMSGTATVTFTMTQETCNPQNGVRFHTGLLGLTGRHWKVRVGNSGANEPFQLNKMVLRYRTEETDV